MSRIKPVCKLDDYSGPLDEATAKNFAVLFSRLCPGQAEPELKGSQLGWAILTAQNPKLP